MKKLYMTDEKAEEKARQLNDFIVQKIKNNELSFKELLDKYKSCSYLTGLLKNTKLFEELTQNNLLNEEDMRYLLTESDSGCALLADKKLSDILIKNDKLAAENLKLVLNTIDNEDELHNLCRNTPLIKYILNEFVLTKETVDKFNTMIENDEWREDRNVHTVFDLIKLHATHYYFENDMYDYGWRKKSEIDQELLELNELNRFLYSFDLTKDQKLELIELIQNNEIVLNRLIQIVDNNLESQFDFDELMLYLNKQEKKNILNI